MAENFTFGFRNCHFRFNFDTAWTVCSAGRQAVLEATKQVVTIKRPQREILRLGHVQSPKIWLLRGLVKFVLAVV